MTTGQSLSRASYDAILVGGGHNGLTAAAYLARAGLSTLVLERRAIVGGACVTEEIAPGCRASTTSYIASMLRPEVIRDLDLAGHGLKMVPCDPALLVPFPDGTAVPWWSERERTVARARKALARGREDVRAGRRRAQAPRALPPALLSRGAPGRRSAGMDGASRSAARRPPLPRHLGLRGRAHGRVPDRLSRRLPRPQLRVREGQDALSREQRLRQARRTVFARNGPGPSLPSAVRRRARDPGFLRPRPRRHGRHHAGDGGGGAGIRSGDPDRVPGRVHRRARREGPRRRARGRAPRSRRPWSSRTRTPSARSWASSPRASCPTSSAARSRASRWTAPAPR